MIELLDISLGYNHKKLLENVNVKFETGMLTSLLGRNGSGKSTLLRAICGLNLKYNGEIKINGNDLRKIPRNLLASKMAYVNTQRPYMANLRCEDIVRLGRSPHTSWHGNLSIQDLEKVEEALKLVGMMEYKDRYFNTLSDGESQKIMIARAIAQDTSIIILDEPTSFLDLPTRYEVVTLLKRLTQDYGKTIVFSTHELDIALELSDMVTLIFDKKLINQTVNEIIGSGKIQKLFQGPNAYLERYLTFLASIK